MHYESGVKTRGAPGGREFVVSRNTHLPKLNHQSEQEFCITSAYFLLYPRAISIPEMRIQPLFPNILLYFSSSVKQFLWILLDLAFPHSLINYVIALKSAPTPLYFTIPVPDITALPLHQVAVFRIQYRCVESERRDAECMVRLHPPPSPETIKLYEHCIDPSSW